jgi:hypothetical protein
MDDLKKEKEQGLDFERRGQPLTLEISFNKAVNLFLSDNSGGHVHGYKDHG